MEHQKIHDHLVQVYGRAGYNEITTKNLRYLNESKTVWEIDVEAKIKSRLHVDEIFHSVATNNTFDGRTQVINEPAIPALKKEKSSPMDMKQFFRKPFDVNAVEVTPDNAQKVADWCGGTVAQGDYKHSKYRIQLPVVKVPGNGPNKGKAVDARIGYFVVEHNGSFRVYRPKQFEETFHAYADNRPYFKPGDLVRDPDNGLEGTVLHVDQVLVTFGGSTHVLFERGQIQHITEFSPKTLERLRDIEAAEIGLDKINALRQAAEDAVMSGAVQTNMAGDIVVEHSPVVEINGYRKDMRIRVKYEHNQFFEQFGTIVNLDSNGVAIWIDLDGDNDEIEPIAFQPDEIEPIGPKLEKGDMIETLIPHDFDGVEIPVGTNGRVVEIDTCEGHNHHVMFADGHYSWFAAYHLKKS